MRLHRDADGYFLGMPNRVVVVNACKVAFIDVVMTKVRSGLGAGQLLVAFCDVVRALDRFVVGIVGGDDACNAMIAEESTDTMTGDWAKLSYDVLGRISSRIVARSRGSTAWSTTLRSSRPPRWSGSEGI